VAGDLVPTAESFMRAGIAAVVTAQAVAERIRSLRAPQVAPAAADLTAQLRRLIHPGCLTAAGPDHARHLHRYLQAMDHRLTKLRERPERDRQLADRIRSIEERFGDVLADPAGAAARWSLEELRVSLFAQHLGTAESVSESRLIAELARLSEGTVRRRA
jgi:ATP-dependent helicase HrpA